MSPEDRHQLKLLIASRGWEIVQKLAEERIAKAKLMALQNTDEAKFLELYRAAHAASNALLEFVADLSGLTEEQI